MSGAPLWRPEGTDTPYNPSPSVQEKNLKLQHLRTRFKTLEEEIAHWEDVEWDVVFNKWLKKYSIKNLYNLPSVEQKLPYFSYAPSHLCPRQTPG